MKQGNNTHKSDGKLRDYSAVLDAKYGKDGTPERARFEEEAYAFYSGQILRDVRRSGNVTQQQLAEKIGTSKSYISKVENGEIIPSVGAFYRMIHALGMQVVIQPAALP